MNRVYQTLSGSLILVAVAGWSGCSSQQEAEPAGLELQVLGNDKTLVEKLLGKPKEIVPVTKESERPNEHPRVNWKISERNELFRRGARMEWIFERFSVFFNADDVAFKIVLHRPEATKRGQNDLSHGTNTSDPFFVPYSAIHCCC